MGDGKFYTIRSEWHTTYLYGYKLWYVIQCTKIVTYKNEVDDIVKDLEFKYGPNCVYKNDSSVIDHKVKDDEKKMAENFNLVIGPVISRFKNNLLKNKFVVCNNIKNDFIFRYQCTKYNCIITIDGLSQNESRWLASACMINHKDNVFFNQRENSIQFTVPDYNMETIFMDASQFKKKIINLMRFKNLKKLTSLLNFIVEYAK